MGRGELSRSNRIIQPSRRGGRGHRQPKARREAKPDRFGPNGAGVNRRSREDESQPGIFRPRSRLLRPPEGVVSENLNLRPSGYGPEIPRLKENINDYCWPEGQDRCFQVLNTIGTANCSCPSRRVRSLSRSSRNSSLESEQSSR